LKELEPCEFQPKYSLYTQKPYIYLKAAVGLKIIDKYVFSGAFLLYAGY